MSRVQSVLFPRRRWGENEAKTWLENHGLRASKLDITERFWRWRQFDPTPGARHVNHRIYSRSRDKGLILVLEFDD